MRTYRTQILACPECGVDVSWTTKKPQRCSPCSQRAEKAAKKLWSKTNPQSVSVSGAKAKAARTQRLAEIKLAIGCFDCGYNKHPDALDFDHVRGIKLFNIGTGKMRTWESVVLEMKKCDVVCANCHRIRTSDRRRGE